MNKTEDVDTLVSSFLDELSVLSRELNSARGEAVTLSDANAFVLIPQVESWTLEDALGIFSRIAVSEGNAELCSFLGTPQGQMRVRTLYRVADGDPALYAAAASLIALGSANGPIETLMQELDDAIGQTAEFETRIYDSLSASEQEDAAIRLLRSWVLYKTGHHQEALALCDKSIQLDPDGVHAWCCRGLILLELGRPEEAVHSCEQALELDDSDSYAWSAHAKSLAAVGNWRECLAAFERALSLGEDSVDVHFGRARALLALDRWREGVTLLDGVLKEHRTTGDAHSILLDLARKALSRDELRAAIKMLLLIYRKHDALGTLEQGLIRCIPDTVPSALTNPDIVSWRDAWRENAGMLPEFAKALRFLDCAVSCRTDPVRRSLSELCEEERKEFASLVMTI